MTRGVVGRTCSAVAVLSILVTARGRASGADETAVLEPSVIFDNTGPNGGLNAAGASPASQLDSLIPFEAGAADDFTLPESPSCRWLITSVRWTGVYWESDPGGISAFRIIIWPDSNDQPPGYGGPTPILSEAMSVFEIPGKAAESARGNRVYDYEATLLESFEAVPGARYWIEIQAVMDYPPQWGWHVTAKRQGAAPVEYFDILRLPAWTPIPDGGDLAFTLLGTPLDVPCDDGNACTEDSCVAGECVFDPITCDDGNACTKDSCSPDQGCIFTEVSCDDGNSCTTDSCEIATGCTHENVSCNDGNACTQDLCSPQDGCAHTPIICDDANACTTDSCDSQTGCVFTEVTCDDHDACTTDSCDSSTGCSFAPIDCDDGNACTVDSCDGGACSHHAPPDFDGDGMIDSADFGFVAACIAGPTAEVDDFCSCADLNGDSRVDLGDYAVLQKLYSGNK